ncbi:LacI family DNA-binding transcriptional regulator [Naumannella halotolerans]|uniref:LacI family transcriptional regulator n=1 Tax=Naumannella halotolerans TaxID=993414 RepID=A0A4R7J786_9ACTN|nr:LacI family DNA-binding transcriptional regulator [Naumannella halotolerans]TDT33291.1 LacI family transcriptional regulator [Naumannella halotolerans]
MTRSITIRDVARVAAVSVATVSNALNRPDRVSSATRQRVLEAVDELGYVPQAVATQRARQQHRRIGVIGPFGTYASYAVRLRGILEILGSGPSEVILFDHPSASRSPSPRLATLPVAGDLDGLIVLGIPLGGELAERLLDRGLPTVLIDSDDPHFSSIVLDEEHGAQMAAEHLLQAGYERFVYITEGQTPTDYVSHGSRRFASFGRALQDLGVRPADVSSIDARAGTTEAGRHAAAQLTTAADRARVGVLAGHDVLAAGVLQGLRERSVSVPEQVGVIGWDGGDLVEALGLSTIEQPLAESGRLGAEQLNALIKNPQSRLARVVLRPRLVPGWTS